MVLLNWSIRASFIVADWLVRVSRSSGLVYRPTDRLSIYNIPRYGCMYRFSHYPIIGGWLKSGLIGMKHKLIHSTLHSALIFLLHSSTLPFPPIFLLDYNMITPLHLFLSTCLLCTMLLSDLLVPLSSNHYAFIALYPLLSTMIDLLNSFFIHYTWFDIRWSLLSDWLRLFLLYHYKTSFTPLYWYNQNIALD